MIKLLSSLFLVFSLGIFTASYAQLADGSIAPNWTLTDLDGNSWTLYDILDEGKTVVIDVSATWCAPCWQYHTSNALEDFYAEFGPTGTDEAMVFFIEGDTETNTACLSGEEGCVGGTQGNWLEGTDYPVIDPSSSSFVTSYAINAYPTVYLICPSRTLVEIGAVGANTLASFMDANCAASGTNNASILTLISPTEFCEDWTGSFILQNLGSEPLTSCTISFEKDGQNVQTISWTGNLPTYQTEDITFNPISSVSSFEAAFTITNVNGGNDDDIMDNSTTAFIAFPMVGEGNPSLEIKTDNFGTETYWEITDEDYVVVASGGNPNAEAGAQTTGLVGGYANNVTINVPLNLPQDGCYNFHIIDDHGDGMCCQYGSGYYRLKDANNNIIFEGGEFTVEAVNSFYKGVVEAAPFEASFTATIDGNILTIDNNTENGTTYLWDFGDGSFSTDPNPAPHIYAASGTYIVTLLAGNGIDADEFSQTITVVLSGIGDMGISQSLVLYPSPAKDVLHIQFTTTGTQLLNVSILDAAGKLIKSISSGTVSAGAKNFSVSTTDLAGGMYILRIIGDHTVSTKRFTVAR